MLVGLVLFALQVPSAKAAEHWVCDSVKYENRILAKDIAYGSDPLQKMDIYVPYGPSLKLPYKTFFLIHGGCFTMGDKDDWDSQQQIKALTEQGFVVVSVNYRLADHIKKTNLYPAAINDVRSAYCWLLKNGKDFSAGGTTYNLVTEKPRVAGYSAGGTLGVMLVGQQQGAGIEPTECGDEIDPPSGIILNPRLDFTQNTEDGKAPGAWDCGEKFIGEQRKVPAQQIFLDMDPKTNIDPSKLGHLFMVSGDSDKSVDFVKNSKALCESSLQRKGKWAGHCELITIRGADHQLPGRMQEAYEQICKRVKEYAERPATRSAERRPSTPSSEVDSAMSRVRSAR